MFREDYIIRHIALFGKVLTRILGLSEGRQYTVALNALQLAFRDFLGVDMDHFITFPEDRLIDFLTFGEFGSARMDKCGFAISLLRETGRLYAAQDHSEKSQVYFRKALNLLLEVILSQEETPELPDFTPTVDELVIELDMLSLSTDTKANLMFYYSRVGSYDKAENTLNGILEVDREDMEIVEFGISFYEYLQDEGDETLMAGNLPREKLEASLANLRVHGD